jgi:hypothetical protein
MMMIRRYFFIPLYFFTFLLFSCEAEGEYSTWPCRFAYNNAVYLDATLASAMTADSRGVYCKIWESTQGGVKYLNFQNNHGMSSQKVETAMEQQSNSQFVIGINNGIIVGFQILNTQPYGGFVAYDVQCPNCVRRENNTISPNYPVIMDSSGIATCRKCGKKYDLNNGGIIQNGEEGDTGLQKYLASTTGPYGFISVGTKR